MSTETSPDPAATPPATTPAPKPKRTPKPKPEDAGVTADAWSAGDAALQVPLAGLLADDPDLNDAKLPADEWQTRLTEYLRSKRSE